MLKKRDLNGHENRVLFDLMVHPDVFPFVRHKASSYEAFLFLTKQTIEAEERGELISRTILDEWGNTIGTINLFDIEDNAGFLGTWLGKPYHGKGYNRLAKEAFFQFLFFESKIETIFIRIRKGNHRSINAALKLPYALKANKTRKEIFNKINVNDYVYDLFEVPKDQYIFYYTRQQAVLGETSCLEA
ncbi:GNAT family N-acetyltransferase [Bacillus chungangensis]|uniref:RimJ/RimL family protein N-acetyltransferase n=1 Tax=Bacillus chungangensis TaxID=587633 RepID=A0ABT9WYN8_9BACI|nr:GNAT family N-acetyltransferase [Bacillus chungangensis]MDQ0178234.1 RimJ/RimL family protein N-acetyltransferase [Bacillus chungangensis]